jgi:hypothetical protein
MTDFPTRHKFLLTIEDHTHLAEHVFSRIRPPISSSLGKFRSSSSNLWDAPKGRLVSPWAPVWQPPGCAKYVQDKHFRDVNGSCAELCQIQMSEIQRST